MRSRVLFLLLLALISCERQSRVNIIGRLTEPGSPENVYTLIPANSISGPALVGTIALHCVTDSIAILHLREAVGYSFRALNLRTMASVDFLRKGRGPNEIIMGYFSGKRESEGRCLLDVCAMNEGLLLSIDLGETLRTRQTSVAEKVELLPFSTASFKLGDQVLSEVVNDEDIFSYKVYDGENHQVSRIIQPFGRDEYVAQWQPLFSAAKKVKPDRSKMAMGMLYFDELNIIDIQGDGHLCVPMSTANDAEIVNSALETGNMGDTYYYLSMAVTDENIFALYRGDERDHYLETSMSTVHVFSWDGRLKAIYQLGQRLNTIALSDDGRTLYGYSGDETIYLYNL